MLRSVLVLLLVSSFSRVSAQIVNIESLRSFVDTNGFHGVENFNIGYTKNTRELLNVTNNLSLKYEKERSAWLFLNTLDVLMANNETLEQNLFFHLRYNYKQNDWLIYEAFTQYQKNVPLRISDRVLAGLGPRFKIMEKEKSSIYVGAILMYEYDDERNTEIVNKDVRLSNYLAVNVEIEGKFKWANYLYYQPRVDKFEDFRTSLQSQLQIQIIKRLAFATTLNLAYDAFPVEDPAIPEFTMKWTNGISYRF